MLSSSDAGPLMIADSLSNLKPLVRILVLLHAGQTVDTPWRVVTILLGQPKNIPSKTFCRIRRRVSNQQSGVHDRTSRESTDSRA